MLRCQRPCVEIPFDDGHVRQLPVLTEGPLPVHIPLDQLGTTDDCGYSPFADDVATSRDTAFAKITARVEGTQMASDQLGV